MRLRPEQLGKHLQQQLLPMYLVSGDELLLVQESCDQLRQHCRQAGFDERQVLEVDANFDWEQLFSAGHSMSLFAERKIVELRMSGAKLDQRASAALSEFAEHADGNTVLIANCQRLDRSAQRAKWVKVFEDRGALLQVWPVDRQQLPRWIDQRLRNAGLQADSDALELLADRVEGNLLAAAQEVEKLRVLAGDQPRISADMVAATVASSARYDVFKLIDNALSGDAAASLRMLHSLRAEGAEGIPLLGAITRELRNLYHCAAQVRQGNGIDRVLDEARVWDKRKALYKSVLRRLPLEQLGLLLQQAQHIDWVQKGQADGDAWLLLSELTSALAGKPLCPLTADHAL